MTNNRYQFLYDELVNLRNGIQELTIPKLSPYARYYPNGTYTPGAINLTQYLLLRQYDLRQLQLDLNELGLSSLGRGEENILDNLNKVIHLLENFSDLRAYQQSLNEEFLISPTINQSNESLVANTNKILGINTSKRQVRIMVTLPTEAATDYDLVHSLVKSGMNCARINCAHDSKQEWLAMIHHIRRAENATGKRCRVMMDIAGQKIRTGNIAPGLAVQHLKTRKNETGEVIAPANILILPQSQFEDLKTTYSAKLFRIGIRDEEHTRLNTGDVLEFTDFRGKKRALEITKCKEPGILLGQCWQAAYISPETEFSCYRQSGGRKSYQSKHITIRVFPPRPDKIKVF
ncbi:MAG: pyruvate kinase, partial [Gammaproteobacteria bacterium]|nr:pyruvate kinase [Gammaproteobacteria bacterium]